MRRVVLGFEMRKLLALAIAIPAAACASPREVEDVRGAPMTTLLPPDAIPAVSRPVFVPASEADGFLAPEEPVLGVVLGGEAKAYSLWHLDRHEIVNDVLTDLPILATW